MNYIIEFLSEHWAEISISLSALVTSALGFITTFIRTREKRISQIACSVDIRQHDLSDYYIELDDGTKIPLDKVNIKRYTNGVEKR